MEAQADSTLEAETESGATAPSFEATAGRRSNRVSLLLRLWQDGEAGHHEPAPVRALVRNLQSGEEHYLDGIDNVLGFVSAAWAGERSCENGLVDKGGDSNEK